MTTEQYQKARDLFNQMSRLKNITTNLKAGGRISFVSSNVEENDVHICRNDAEYHFLVDAVLKQIDLKIAEIDREIASI